MLLLPGCRDAQHDECPRQWVEAWLVPAVGWGNTGARAPLALAATVVRSLHGGTAGPGDSGSSGCGTHRCCLCAADCGARYFGCCCHSRIAECDSDSSPRSACKVFRHIEVHCAMRRMHHDCGLPSGSSLATGSLQTIFAMCPVFMRRCHMQRARPPGSHSVSPHAAPSLQWIDDCVARTHVHQACVAAAIVFGVHHSVSACSISSSSALLTYVQL